MSAEIVEGPGGLYVITGHPATGYDVRPVGGPVASYERKMEARRQVRSGAVRAAGQEPEPARPVPDVLCEDGQCGVCWGCRKEAGR